MNDIIKGVNEGGPPDFNKGIYCNATMSGSISQKLTISLRNISGKPYFNRIEDHIAEESSGYGDGLTLPMSSPARSSPQSQSSEVTERFSRKVFVGGLPPDIDEGKLLPI